MKVHSLLLLSSLLCSLAVPRPARADGSITINPGVNDGPAQLLIQGPTLDSTATAPGLAIGHSEAAALLGQMELLSVGIFRLNRPTGLYQWQFSGAMDRLAMELKNDHRLVLHSSDGADHVLAADQSDPDQNAIELRPGPDGGVFFNGARLASAAETSLSLLGGGLAYTPDFQTYADFGPQETATGMIAAGPSSNAFGTGAVAIGQSARARMHNSMAIGANATAEYFGMAFGRSAFSSGGTAVGTGSHALWFGTALGFNAYGDGVWSTAVGTNSYAGSWFSIAVGGLAYGPNDFAAAWGTTWGDGSIALGGYAGADKSFAADSGVTWGKYSVAIGRGTVTGQDYQVALGTYNTFIRRFPDSVADTVPYVSDPLLVIGNGYVATDGTEIRSNAFTVGYDGAAWIQGGLTVEGGSAEAPAPTVFKRDVSVQGVLRVPESGDLSMGAFTAGPQP
jgi:hypothetical protein